MKEQRVEAEGDGKGLAGSARCCYTWPAAWCLHVTGRCSGLNNTSVL